MKRLIPTLLAATVVLSATGCTPELINQAVAALQKASIQLTTTDETGQETTLGQGDVESVQLDGAEIPAEFDSNGELMLPEGNYSQERQLRVRLKSGEVVLMPLRPNVGQRDGKLLKFAGQLHRTAGKIIAGDVLPGGQMTAEARLQHLQRRYVVVDLNKPELRGKLRQRGIGKWRLPLDSFVISPEGDLLIQPGLLQRYANHPGVKLWAVVEVAPGKFRLLVIKIEKPPVVTSAAVPTADQEAVIAASGETATTEELDVGEEVVVETDETTGDEVDPATFDPATEEDLAEETTATTETEESEETA